jgi:V8-like Glu-specific endopeptidase
MLQVLCENNSLKSGDSKMKIAKQLLNMVAALALFASAPALAVTDGELDGEGHPAVGLLIFDVAPGQPGWRCSGTLISPTVILTAGHCTDGAVGGRVWFDADEADILAKGYPFGGAGAIEFATVATHPLYPTAPFFVNDVGIVILSEPVILDAEDYGALPQLNELDQMKTRRGKQNQMFTAVGYGLQRINPVFVEAERTRMVAYPHLIQINVPGFTGDFSLLLSNNHSTGGTCFGDSGGPNFIGTSNVIGGVTSFGINGNCAGTGGVFRIDRANALDWINTYLP